MKASQVLTGEFNRHKSVQQTCSHVLDYLVSMLYNGSYYYRTCLTSKINVKGRRCIKRRFRPSRWNADSVFEK